MNVKHRIIALVGGGLLAAGLAVGTAGAASASVPQYRDHDRCSVRLDERGDRLRVEIRSNADNDRARVRANFDRGRDDTNTVRLNRNGDGYTSFDIPDRARRAEVTVRINSDHGRDHRDITCSDSIRLDGHRHHAAA